MKINYNFEQRKRSPVIPEYQRNVDVVDDVEVVSYGPVVLPKFPTVEAFTIEAMMAAGVSPESINISTQNVDRLDGLDQMASFVAEADSLLNPNNNE